MKSLPVAGACTGHRSQSHRLVEALSGRRDTDDEANNDDHDSPRNYLAAAAVAVLVVVVVVIAIPLITLEVPLILILVFIRTDYFS